MGEKKKKRGESDGTWTAVCIWSLGVGSFPETGFICGGTGSLRVEEKPIPVGRLRFETSLSLSLSAIKIVRNCEWWNSWFLQHEGRWELHWGLVSVFLERRKMPLILIVSVPTPAHETRESQWAPL